MTKMSVTSRKEFSILLDEEAADAIISIASHYLITESAHGSVVERNRIVAVTLREELSVARNGQLPPEL